MTSDADNLLKQARRKHGRSWRGPRPPHVGWLLILGWATMLVVGALVVGADHRWAYERGLTALGDSLAVFGDSVRVRLAQWDSLTQGGECVWIAGPRQQRTIDGVPVPTSRKLP